jgi:hypothetical protein
MKYFDTRGMQGSLFKLSDCALFLSTRRQLYN